MKRTTLDSRKEREYSREEQVQKKAYELYEKRGRENGHDVEDWYEAEKNLAESGAET